MKNPLRHFRFSLAGLFGATLFAACVVATLRFATRLWADALFTLALAAVAVAALGALYRRGAARAFWIGALVGGGGYLFLAYGPWIGESVRPHLVTAPLLSMAYERLQANHLFSRCIGRPDAARITHKDAGCVTRPSAGGAEHPEGLSSQRQAFKALAAITRAEENRPTQAIEGKAAARSAK